MRLATLVAAVMLGVACDGPASPAPSSPPPATAAPTAMSPSAAPPAMATPLPAPPSTPLPDPSPDPLSDPTPSPSSVRPSDPPSDEALDPAGITPDELSFCVAETNRYRALAKATVVAESADVTKYAQAAAQADGTSGTAHGYTRGVGRPRVSYAENEVVRWPRARYGSVPAVIAAAMKAFWDEGPGGGHYENLRGPWRVVGCGVFVDGDDRVTMVQHFR